MASLANLPEVRETTPRSIYGVLEEKPVIGMVDMGAYEHLWLNRHATFESIAGLFRQHPGALPSDFVPEDVAVDAALEVMRQFDEVGVAAFGVCVHGAGDYTDRLRDAKDPVELLYYRGNWELASSPQSIAVVGTRNASREGIARTKRLVRMLVANDFTVVSGLARGVDTAAHRAAIESGGRTIAVVGTPLNVCYPAENLELQELIARDHLLVSQVPVLRYGNQDYRRNRLFFPERNKTMSALTDATVIIEAGETSGTLIQARAALDQGRKLFILDSCFSNPSITWPAKFEREGAVRVRDFEQILTTLAPPDVAGER